MQNKAIMRFFYFFILLFLLGCNNRQSEKISFTVLQLNDVYEIAPVEGGKYGGLARVATLKKELLKEDPDLIAMLSGDFVSPSLTGTLQYEGEPIKGKHMVETLNALGLDYVTFGNHEFDIDYQYLQSRIQESDFDWTSCNTFQRTEGGHEPFAKEINGEKQHFPEYIIHKVVSESGDTLKVGIIGVTLPFNKADYVVYEDMYDAFKKTYEQIKDQCNLVLGLTHLEVDMDEKLAEMVPGVPLILGGHDHTHMKKQVGQTVITKADANAKTVYVHRIIYDPATKAVSIESELDTIDSRYAADPEVDKVVQKWVKIASESMIAMGYKPDEVIVNTTEVLDGRESSIRYKPTNFGILTAEAFLYAVPEADMGFLNSGSIRLDDQLTGNISQYDILRSFPFGGEVAICDMKGAVLKKTLDIGTEENIGIGGYLQIANAEKKDGQWYIKEEPLNENRTYKVVLTKFVKDGREKNLEFLGDLKAEVPDSLKNQTIRNDIRDMVIAYMKRNGQSLLSGGGFD